MLNTDIARELFHEYNMARALHSASVHEPASCFIKRLYEERLAMAEARRNGHRAVHCWWHWCGQVLPR